jgi:hypothetical protein
MLLLDSNVLLPNLASFVNPSIEKEWQSPTRRTTSSHLIVQTWLTLWTTMLMWLSKSTGSSTLRSSERLRLILSVQWKKRLFGTGLSCWPESPATSSRKRDRKYCPVSTLFSTQFPDLPSRPGTDLLEFLRQSVELAQSGSGVDEISGVTFSRYLSRLKVENQTKPEPNTEQTHS